MSPVEIPKPVEHHVKADAQEEARRSANDAFFKELLSTPTKDPRQMTRVSDVGQISEMQLPVAWKLGTTDNTGGTMFKEFHPADKPDVKMCFYYRGQRISQSGGDAFKSVLEKPAHVLRPAEIETLSEVMRNKEDPKVFQMTGAHTEDINGKRVLVVEGRYLEKQYDTRAVYVDSDGTGTAIQEVYFQAPKVDYMLNIAKAKDAFRTIKWK